MSSTLETPSLRFGDVEIGPRDGRVARAGVDQHLRPKVFQVLLYLCEHRDRIVSREELIANVWPETFVTDDALVQCIVDLRRAFGDDARNPQFIRTIPKRGYRFIAPESSAAVPCAEVEETSESIEYEVVEETERPVRQWNAFVVPVLTLSIVLLSAAAYRTARGRAQAAPSRAALPFPLDAPTPNAEAYRLYSLAVHRANVYREREAIALLEQALKLDPEYAMARARVGWVRGVVGNDVAQAGPDIERALALSGRLSERERMHVLAWQDIVRMNYPDAIDRYRVIIDRYPTDIEAYQRLAKLLAGEERIEEALEVLDRAQAIEPRSPLVLNSLGMNSALGRHEKAIAGLHRYVEIEPYEANAWDSLALSLQWAGRYGEAFDAYARALELHPGFVLARFHRAGAYAQLGRFQDAIRDVEQCLAVAKSENERARALATMGELYGMKGDEASMRAIEARIPPGVGWDSMRRRVEEHPESWKDDPARWESSRTRAGRGQRAERRKELYWDGRAALGAGRVEDGISLLRRAMRLRPLIWYVDPLETALGDAFLELGRFSEAADEYRRVLGINANYARARYGLARSLQGLGQRDAARVEYERLVALWKDADADARDLVDARAQLAHLR